MKSRSIIFGRNLRLLRESRGLSQEQAAKLIGLSIAQYNRTEAGNTTIDLDRIALISGVFSVPVEVLLLDVFEYSSIAEEKKTLINAIIALAQSLSQASLRLLLRITQDLFQHDQDLDLIHH